ncbi:CYTH domain-containing protein [Synechococcus sp. Cruz-9H2]|uniref:CYTH domain-containing protein n=1 Tax=unclassified Synechococcus TaxID=2626047 RepID=UPI0020CEA447|nr:MULTISPECIES: CYTH domain-containing protein [unclassified Synechococcus]MCP9820497.1 CYTH domain-containing protein [Synechococcus sp. Cruz-9H2]MCP9843290.1 CYTH domain-containing protein [Synechococcus sp. Edmonson 11F2]MCP9855035.1 CYTH domain-containing protein [Synechococcus sp. Cruz-9C9]MCP9862494.1 CYTH domain-containing protein [Synechococcus sp. Cruz-7E5]MCP9871403.1 CYTH domain-containing protein [Synechococcus sp. Cruz-7B9]
MSLEIERRFLVGGTGWREHILWRQHLCQGYLQTSADGVTVRVRLEDRRTDATATAGRLVVQPDPERSAGCSEGGARAWLTLKATVTAITRKEFEYVIPADDARQLLGLAAASLSKERYGLDLPGGDWVLDVFEGENAPLVVAEVELEREDQPLTLPSWCGREITGRGELSNAALARRPWSSWSEAARQELLVDSLCNDSDIR